ncbi:MAG: hypothetical protein QOF51_993 [Chloroflexota bacterium]|nr:hypothetical protein [Chloroflexota bacterium]
MDTRVAAKPQQKVALTHRLVTQNGFVTRSTVARIGVAVSLAVALLLSATLGLVPPRASADTALELVTLPTRPGITMNVLIGTSNEDKRAIVVQFPGGNGAGHFRQRPDGSIQTGLNFLVRSNDRFVGQHFVTAILDVPSDRATGMGNPFRVTAMHTQDVRAAIDYLSSRWSLPIYLSGTSTGTVSAAHMGIALNDPRVAGIIMTSTLDAVAEQPVATIRLPVLMMHHQDDGCSTATYAAAQATFGKLTGSARANFVTVQGGDPPISTDPCEAQAPHGYLGVEQEVVNTISDWIAGNPVPTLVTRLTPTPVPTPVEPAPPPEDLPDESS